MTLRIAHISDTHFNERGRMADLESALNAFLDECRSREVDLILHAGDWYERASTPAERLAAVQFLRAAGASATYPIPVFGVKGNHDRPVDIDVFNFLGLRNVKVVERPGVYRFKGRRGEYNIAAVPWFDKQHVVAATPAEDGAERTRQLTIEQAGALLMALKMEAYPYAKIEVSPGRTQTTPGPIPLFLGHVLVGGSEVSSGQTLIGTSVEFSPADLAGFSYAALGHVHKRQEWYAGRIAYSGSPTRCNFGEPEAKGFNLVTLEDDGTFVSNEFVELPGRAMFREECDFTSGVPQDIFGRELPSKPGFFECRDDWEGALVRVRITVRAQDLSLLPSAADMEAEWLRLTLAAEIKVEIVVESETRQRAPEIAEATTVRAKVEAWAKAKGVDVGDGVLAKLRELERA